MKRVVLGALLAIFAMNNYSYGQMLECKEGPNKKWGFVNGTGELIIPYKYEYVRPFSEGLAAVKPKGKRWGFIDENGKVVIPFKFAIATDFRDGVVPVMKGNGKHGFIDKSGVEVLRIKYASWEEAADAAIAMGIYHGLGLDMEMLKHKGIIDETGKVIAPMKCTCTKE